MRLENNLNLNRREEIILKEIFTEYQNSLLRLYSGESGLYSLETGKDLWEVVKSPEYQTKLSDDFLRFQEFLESPVNQSMKKADRDDLLIINYLFYNYLEELQVKYGEVEVIELMEKITKCSDAHSSLEQLNSN